MIELTEMPHDGWIEGDFFLGLTKRGYPQVLPRLLTTTGETHLTAVATKRL